MQKVVGQCGTMQRSGHSRYMTPQDLVKIRKSDLNPMKARAYDSSKCEKSSSLHKVVSWFAYYYGTNLVYDRASFFLDLNY